MTSNYWKIRMTVSPRQIEANSEERIFMIISALQDFAENALGLAPKIELEWERFKGQEPEYLDMVDQESNDLYDAVQATEPAPEFVAPDLTIED